MKGLFQKADSGNEEGSGILTEPFSVSKAI